MQDTTSDVRTFMQACGQEVSDSIMDENPIVNTRLYTRLIAEEFCELLISICPKTEMDNIRRLREELERLSEYANRTLTLEEKVFIADDLCDIVYVSHGLANVLGLKFEEAKREVNNSNMSKLHNGIALRDENNKVIKGPSYFKPKLMEVLLSNESS